jgi:hypothetical protein
MAFALESFTNGLLLTFQVSAPTQASMPIRQGGILASRAFTGHATLLPQHDGAARIVVHDQLR